MIFNDIKIGDTVEIRVACSAYAMEYQKRITKVTKTQFTVEGGDRYLRNSGYLFGTSQQTKGVFNTAIKVVK